MKKKIFLTTALAAVTLLAACGEPENNPSGNNTGAVPTAVPAANTAAPASNTAAPETNTSAPASNTAAPASNTTAPASNTAAPASNTAAPAANTAAPASNTAAPAANTAAPTAAPNPTAKPADTSNPVQTVGKFDAIAGSWYSAANYIGGYGHGELFLDITSDGASSLGTLVSDGDGRYHVAGTTMTLSLEKWADGSERLYYYDTYTYEDATYSRKN